MLMMRHVLETIAEIFKQYADEKGESHKRVYETQKYYLARAIQHICNDIATSGKISIHHIREFEKVAGARLAAEGANDLGFSTEDDIALFLRERLRDVEGTAKRSADDANERAQNSLLRRIESTKDYLAQAHSCFSMNGLFDLEPKDLEFRPEVVYRKAFVDYLLQIKLEIAKEKAAHAGSVWKSASASLKQWGSSMVSSDALTKEKCGLAEKYLNDFNSFCVEDLKENETTPTPAAYCRAAMMFIDNAITAENRLRKKYTLQSEGRQLELLKEAKAALTKLQEFYNANSLGEQVDIWGGTRDFEYGPSVDARTSSHGGRGHPPIMSGSSHGGFCQPYGQPGYAQAPRGRGYPPPVAGATHSGYGQPSYAQPSRGQYGESPYSGFAQHGAPASYHGMSHSPHHSSPGRATTTGYVPGPPPATRHGGERIHHPQPRRMYSPGFAKPNGTAPARSPSPNRSPSPTLGGGSPDLARHHRRPERSPSPKLAGDTGDSYSGSPSPTGSPIQGRSPSPVLTAYHDSRARSPSPVPRSPSPEPYATKKTKKKKKKGR